MAEDPHGLTSYKGYLGIFTLKRGKLSAFNFSVLGWELRVTYNSDIFEKLRPPSDLQMSEFEFQTSLFFDPPPYFGHCTNIFPFLNCLP